MVVTVDPAVPGRHSLHGNDHAAEVPMTTLTFESARTVSPTSGTRPPAVDFHAVTHRFGDVTALDGIDLSISTGETVALLGPNGAGKSTAIALMLGLLEPTDGSVTTLGTRPRNAVASGRVGSMLQDSGLPERARVGELIRFARDLYADPLDVTTVLHRSGLTSLAARSISGLSGGEAQRVRFALAIAGDPDLLFLDEPTVAMDVETRRAFWADIRRATDEGRTVVFATHYLEEADQVADRIVVLDHGRVVADGTGRSIRAGVGGRTIRFDLPDAVAYRDQLGSMPGVTAIDIEGNRVRLTTSDGDATVRAIVLGGLDIRDLESTSVGLEDAFLSIVSRDPDATEEIPS
jgi:ABC-2 type transport system ATP-binding protein